MPAVVCEYDGTLLLLTDDGLEPTCPLCEADIEAHRAMCRTCRWMGDADDVINLRLEKL